jgi:UDP-2-acetamido-3-amino-2,3-dideoxy-glucuronate N-acetyltransferase
MLKSLLKFSREEGDLYALNKIEQFDAKRMFYVTGVPKGAVRGRHAHKKDKQLLVCLKGAVKVTLDSGGSPSEFFLSEGKSLFMDSLVWGIQEYTTGEDVLLVLCSEEHDPEDYITHYFKFLELVKEKTDV